MTDLQQQFIDKIKQGDLTMKPRWHFLLNTAFFVVGTILSTLIVVYLLSFVTFALQQSGAWFAPSFGWKGLTLFLLASPWIIIGFALIFLALLAALAQRYSFCYERPFLYTLLGVSAIAFSGAYLVEATDMHPRMHIYLNHHHVPGLAPMYKQAQKRPPTITEGTIHSFTEKGFILQTESNKFVNIIITSDTRLGPNWETIGMEVMVFGKRASNTVVAFGVKPDLDYFSDTRKHDLNEKQNLHRE